MGWDSSAFVLLNRFLDVADLIEESRGEGSAPDPALLDNTDFEHTDIPFDNLCIPSRPCVSGALKENAKEWILAVSLDQRVEQVINMNFKLYYFKLIHFAIYK